MPNVKNNAAAQETRRRLIEAAGEIFAERGLHAATTKEITDRAGVNAAAINYHFRDKFELYAAVIRHALSQAPVAFLTHAADAPPPPPEDRLRAYVTNILQDFRSSSRPAWHATLIAHELVQPTAALQAVMEELIRPWVDYIEGIVRDILGPDAPRDQIIRAAMSVSSQCFLYRYKSQLTYWLYPQLLHEENLQPGIDHIVAFSLAALRGLRSQ
ncbi:MAG: CerR family C-terminal domain-containing protein [Phycisphaerales bacterium]|nr:CerR family C-terminal domain-containing protein [Phycisphaerales bacterium]